MNELNCKETKAIFKLNEQIFFFTFEKKQRKNFNSLQLKKSSFCLNLLIIQLKQEKKSKERKKKTVNDSVLLLNVSARLTA